MKPTPNANLASILTQIAAAHSAKELLDIRQAFDRLPARQQLQAQQALNAKLDTLAGMVKRKTK